MWKTSLFAGILEATEKGIQVQQDTLWQAVLGEIELSVSRGNFITWFKNTSLVSHEEGVVVVGVNNIFIRQSLEKKYSTLLTETLEKNGIQVTKIEYKMVANTAEKPVAHQKEPVNVTKPTANSLPVNADSGDNNSYSGDGSSVLSHSYGQGLNERYIFDNFVVGDGNELAFAACQSIATQPGTKYNPLLLYGGVGIGKTHLIQAVGNAIAAADPKTKVLYISTEQFVREFVQALRNRTTAAFASYYRAADVLIVDDIQFIAGKDKMQEEFFHTFNTLHQANKQIIMSSDKPPREIPTLEARLQSRFAGGMSIDMQIPDFETRCAIIETKAQAHGTALEPEVIEYLATNGQSNIRELEGALNQLLAWCEMRGIEPSMDLAASLLNVNKSRPKHLSAKQIIERTARHFQIPMEDIVGPKRDKDIVVPRQVAMYMLRNELHLSFPKIAKELGRKDHTTAIHSVEKIQKESQLDPSLRTAISEIKETLYA